jgi:hypothetical protein
MSVADDVEAMVFAFDRGDSRRDEVRALARQVRLLEAFAPVGPSTRGPQTMATLRAENEQLRARLAAHAEPQPDAPVAVDATALELLAEGEPEWEAALSTSGVWYVREKQRDGGVWGRDVGHHPAEVEARLMAAAPSLFGSLREARRSIIGNGVSERALIIEWIDEALAKARGGA